MSRPGKTGTFDKLVGADGKEVGVYIVEDTPTKMVVRVTETGEVYHLIKHVQ
jgi:hypothetical protein